MSKMKSNACIIFDIDGVLIDTTKSYNKTITETVEYLVKHIDPTNENARRVASEELIFNFRKSGMFNNDIDTCYAFILGIMCGPPKFSELYFFVENIAKKETAGGIASVENYLSHYSESRLKKIKRLLNYPGDIHGSLLPRIFDEFFYGPHLFKRQHSTSPKYYFSKPLIENDQMLVTNSTMKKVSNIFDKKIGIVSGRSKLAAEYSMKSLFKFFDITASFYLDDEKREMRKPNPLALVKSIKSFGVDNALYVGDSTEDLLMVQNARKVSDINIELIGICAPNTRSDQVRSLFNNNGVSLIVKEVNELPNILNKVMNQF
jgi:HAD superfamily phosphatase